MQLVPPGWANLVEKLEVLSQQQSTGELILSSGSEQWYLYLLFGRLLYATGGAHRIRRWQRVVTHYCPGFKFHIYSDRLSEGESWECQLLHQGINQNQMSLTQAKNIISNSIHEVLFALVGCAELSNRWLPKKQHPIALLEVKEFLVEAEHLWQQWQEMGLGQLFPDQVPVFKQPLTELNLEADATALSLLRQVNGTHTIWDIALQVRQPIISVASALQHLINQGTIELQTIPDLSFPIKASSSSNQTQNPQSLIADDLPLTQSSVNAIESPVISSEGVATNVLTQIQACVHEQFTGRLDVEDTQVQQWSLYFRQGHLIGCASSVHPVRRWCRQLSQYCPELAVEAVGLQLDRTQCWDDNFLTELVRQGKILRGQMAAIQVIEGLLIEILFDIYQCSAQQGNRSGLQLVYKRVPENNVESTDLTLPEKLISSIRSEQVWQQAMQAWEAWQQAGFVDFSPNLAPTIQQAEELQRQTSSVAYQNLSILADGHRTLRDLALKLNQNLLPLTQSLMPYIHQNLIRLIKIGDREMPVLPENLGKPSDTRISSTVLLEDSKRQSNTHEVTGRTSHPATRSQILGKTAPSYSVKPNTQPASTSQIQAQPSASLVAYIDDSRSDSLTMSTILTQTGYRFISIQDPVKALPMLLEQKPELIFLDLIMPIANGYEICAQIRRISIFKDTPVIIVTSNDGIVDRVRAKMIGSSGFLAKPIDREKVQKILQRYLPDPKRV